MDWVVNGLRRLLELSTYALVGWISSWVIFIIIHPFITSIFGKAQAMGINYGLTWISGPLITLGLAFSLEKEDLFDELITIRV
jgi:hypothetical protein